VQQDLRAAVEAPERQGMKTRMASFASVIRQPPEGLRRKVSDKGREAVVAQIDGDAGGDHPDLADEQPNNAGLLRRKRRVPQIIQPP
jgi:hypothetical protein